MVEAETVMSRDTTIVNVSVINSNSSKEKQNFEDVLESIGGFGLFQWIILIVLLFPEIPGAFVLFIPVLVGRDPSSWTCNSSGIISTFTSQNICMCNGTISSQEDLIVTEWNLVCEKSWVSDSINSVQMFGMVIGGIVASQSSDWCGRKVTYIVVCVLMVLGQLFSAISPSPMTYAVARFIAGAGVSGFMGMSTVYPMEFLTPKWRFLCGSVGPWGEGIMLMAILGYFVQNWRYLLLLSAIPFITIPFTVVFMPESPKWLLRNHKLKRARSALMNMARINGIKNLELSDEMLESMATGEMQGLTKTKFSYFSFFKYPHLRKKTIVLNCIWFAYGTVYYGLNYNVKNMNGSPYLNVFLMGLSDAIGYPLALLLNNRIGRRKSLIVFMTWAAVFLVLLAILDLFYNESLGELTVPIICLVGKLGIAGARSSSRLLTGEAYPTPIRTMAFGLTGISAGIGGIMSPQIVFLGSIWWRGLPFLFFAIISVIGSVCSLMLPETAGQVLQEQISPVISVDSPIKLSLDVETSFEAANVQK